MTKKILVKLDGEEWDLMKKGEKTMLIFQDRPDVGKLPVQCLAYVRDTKAVIGSFQVTHFLKTARPWVFENRALMSENKLREMAQKGDVYCWVIEACQELPVRVEMTKTEIKQFKTWKYVEGTV